MKLLLRLLFLPKCLKTCWEVFILFQKEFFNVFKKEKKDSFMFARLKAVCAKRAFYSTSTLLAKNVET
jgi:hypothetical protein